MEIKIRPSQKQIFSGSFHWVILNILSIIAVAFFLPEAVLLSLIPGVYLITTLVTLLCRWIMIYNTSWTITSEVILQRRGVLTHTTDHVELYRVVDYQESQDFCQRLLGIKTLHLICRDHIRNAVSIVGIPASSDLMQKIRDNVEICRRNKGIYEYFNH